VWEADRKAGPAPTRGVVSYLAFSHTQVDRKALARLPIETPEAHCRRVFGDHFCAHESFYHGNRPVYGSSSVSCTVDSASEPTCTLIMPILFLGPPISPLLLPSPITGDLLRRLSPERLEIFMAEMLQLAEFAAEKNVCFSNLRFGHFGYGEQENGVPVMLGLLDFVTVYLELDKKDLDWYLEKTKGTLENDLKKVFGR
jgi:hypothetical protein